MAKQGRTIEADVQRFMLSAAEKLEAIGREAARLLPALRESESYQRAQAASEAGEDDAPMTSLAWYLSGTLADQLSIASSAHELGALFEQLRHEGNLTEASLRAETRKRQQAAFLKVERPAFVANEVRA